MTRKDVTHLRASSGDSEVAHTVNIPGTAEIEAAKEYEQQGSKDRQAKGATKNTPRGTRTRSLQMIFNSKGDRSLARYHCARGAFSR